MILVDLSQVMMSNIFVNAGHYMAPNPGEETGRPFDEGLIRHMVLNSLRYYKMKFGKKYGKLVIACDSKHYWRKEIFPHYKHGRAKARKESPLDWQLIHNTMNLLKAELAEFFPYQVIDIPRAEADDIIGVIAKREHTVEKVLVLSGDKDFVQLQKYKNVDQYAPIQKTFVYPADGDAVVSLRTHIMCGDDGDGIPNFMSPDDTFVTGQRQVGLKKDNLARWAKESKPENFCDIKMLRGWKRNQQLIDLDYIPKDVVEAIVEAWDAPFVPSRKHLLDYFIRNKLDTLLGSIGEF